MECTLGYLLSTCICQIGQTFTLKNTTSCFVQHNSTTVNIGGKWKWECQMKCCVQYYRYQFVSCDYCMLDRSPDSANCLTPYLLNMFNLSPSFLRHRFQNLSQVSLEYAIELNAQAIDFITRQYTVKPA